MQHFLQETSSLYRLSNDIMMTSFLNLRNYDTARTNLKKKANKVNKFSSVNCCAKNSKERYARVEMS